MKEFNLFKVLSILTLICLVVSFAGLSVGSVDGKELEIFLSDNLELKNWHYFLLIIAIWQK